MPNLNFNAGFEPEEGSAGEPAFAKASAGEDNLSALGFHAADENEDDLREDADIKPAEDEAEDFDLDADDEADVCAPTAVSAVIEDEEESAADEPAYAKASPFAEATEDKSADEDEELIEEEDLDDDDEEENIGEDSVLISKAKIIMAEQLLENIQKCSAKLSSLFGSFLSENDEERISIAEISDGFDAEEEDDYGHIVEGVFNGENMIGPDGKEYSVPANYASKSKLVEGDMLKLTITDRGTFVYKQTKPIERKRVIGKLEKDSNGNYQVKAEHKKFRVITASITYYKGIPGDKVVLLIPVAGDSAWGAVENVIKSK
ncbi:MAG: hypothetical protein PHO56_01105 [Patescibacteria group bacterium]|nr:hypothetical protein [Patescibacteria group bacterium]